jgi:hypothetical protein
MILNIQKRKSGLSRKQAASARLTLVNGEVRRLCPLPPGIRVISGWAWVSWKGQDTILVKGQEIWFSRGSDDPVVSAVGRSALAIEFLL